MEYHELIQEFLDGAIDTANEDKLLMLVANDEDIRAEFKRALAIDSSLKSDALGLAPSAKSTLSVFSTLGFSAPAGFSGASNNGMLSRIKNFGKFYRNSILTGFIASALTALAVVFIMQSNSPENMGDKLTYRSDFAANFDASSLAKGPQYPVISSYETDFKNDMTPPVQTRIRTIIRYRYITKELPSGNSLLADNKRTDQTDEKINNTDPENVNLSLSDIRSSLPKTEYKPLPAFNQNFELPPIPTSENLGIHIKVAGMEDGSLNSPNMPRPSGTILENKQLEIIFPGVLTDNLDIGIGVRQERFFQRFSGFDETIGKRVEYTQYPSLVTFELSGRYNLENLFPVDNLGLFMQGSVGGNIAGPVFRIMPGFTYKGFESIYFYAGLEYSYLKYQHSGSGFDSQKIGINYGLIFNL